MPHRLPTAVTAAAALLLAAGCSADGAGPAPGAPSPERSAAAVTGPERNVSPPPAEGSAEVTRTLATGLDSPWGVAALPGGDLLVGSRDKGTLTRVSARDGRKTEVGAVPGAAPGGEGGLLGLAVSPSFRGDPLVYAYVTTASDNRIVRMSYDDTRRPGDQLGAPSTVLRAIPKGRIHNGGRLAFGPDRMLYASTGETGREELAQDRKSLGGKILRMTPDGAPARGNPDPRSVVYSYGHRNVEGLAWDGAKRLWASEFGEDTWDELNLIEPGRNYGWPAREGKGPAGGGYVDPVLTWKPADASPSGLAYAKGSLWMAALRGERLWRVPLDGTRPAAAPQAFLTKRYGRLRTVLPADDGALWLVTGETDGRGRPRKGDDRILRVTVG